MRFRTRRSEEPSVELTPLIDVVFLLLIFLMVSTTFVSPSGLQVEIPEAETTRSDPEAQRVTVTVTEDGRYRLGGEALAPDADLATVLRRRAQGKERPLLVIRADRDARHKAVTAVMDAGKSAGLSRIAIATTRPGGDGGS